MAAKKTTKASATRGVALVEQVIAKVEAGKGGQIDIADPRPIPAEVLNDLKFTNGKPLPPSLKRWLAFDGSWAMRALGLFDDLDTPVLEPEPVWRLVKDNISDLWYRAFKQLPEPLPQEPAMALDIGSESMRMLFLGEPDAEGEYPVIGVDVDDTPVVTLESPGFDTWLAEQAGLVDLGKAPWSAVMKESRKRWFGGAGELEIAELSDAVDDDELTAPAPAPKKAPKPAAPIVVKEGLAEDRLGKGMVEAMEVGDNARFEAWFAAARERYPKAAVWGGIVLQKVAYGADAELARRLFAAGVDPDACAPYAAFELACAYASADVVKAFVDAGATLDRQLGEFKEFALGQAADQKRVEIVKLLLDAGANPRLTNKHGNGAIHKAASPKVNQDRAEYRTQSTAIVQLLLDAGVDVDMATPGPSTALHAAVEYDNKPLLDLLLERGANPNLQNWRGDTVLSLAVRHRRKDMIAALRAKGARSDIRNADGWCVDDVAPAGVAGPKAMDVRLPCGPGRHRAKLVLEISLNQASLFTVGAFAGFVGSGGGGSDVYPPWAGSMSMRGDDLQSGQRGEWELEWEGVAPAAFAFFLRELVDGNSGYVVRALSLVGDGEPTIDTERARALLADPSLEPIRPWPDPGFAVSDKGKGPNRFAWVQTRRALDGERVRSLISALETLMRSLPYRVFGTNTGFNLEHGPIAEHGFELVLRWYEKTGVFPHDPALVRTLTINALTKLHHETDAIAALEWALGVAGDEGTAAPTPADAGPVEGDAVEISPSGRAACRTCKEKIDKGVLRFVEMDEFGSKRYHHLACAAKTLSRRLLAGIAAYAGEVPEREAIVALASKR